jgi:hypothetical protein
MHSRLKICLGLSIVILIHGVTASLSAQNGATPLTRHEADALADELWQAHQSRIREERRAEWDAKKIILGEREMKFEFRTFGAAPEHGHSLFISMHGGGGAPASVNEQQWNNQIGLYEPAEGVYLAPRAPTNSWNLWHEAHIDPLFERIIGDAVVFENVDPDRVYLMGYSAGGDGVYQLAPRMADRLAAAAMMAGHPNNASPLGLRNIGFAIHMGGEDAAYNRNQVAAEWGKKLDALQTADPDGYRHSVTIHEGLGHWMNRKDAVALEWMADFVRNPDPKRVVWYQSGVTHGQFYWLAVDQQNQTPDATVIVQRNGQTFTIEQADGIKRLTILLNDSLVDLDQPVIVRFGERELFNGSVNRSSSTLANTLEQRGDRSYMYSAQIDLDISEGK